jgi:hypothetical protein
MFKSNDMEWSFEYTLKAYDVRTQQVIKRLTSSSSVLLQPESISYLTTFDSTSELTLSGLPPLSIFLIEDSHRQDHIVRTKETEDAVA